MDPSGNGVVPASASSTEGSIESAPVAEGHTGLGGKDDAASAVATPEACLKFADSMHDMLVPLFGDRVLEAVGTRYRFSEDKRKTLVCLIAERRGESEALRVVTREPLKVLLFYVAMAFPSVLIAEDGEKLRLIIGVLACLQATALIAEGVYVGLQPVPEEPPVSADAAPPKRKRAKKATS